MRNQWRQRVVGMALGLVLAGAAVLALSGAASAAQVGPSSVEGCDYELVGTIDGTEAGQLRRLVRAPGDAVVLCMRSPGGSLAGGLALFELLPELNVVTRIPAGWRCESACALAFMGGRAESGLGMGAWNPWVGHILEPGGLLGFHAPSVAFPAGQSYTANQVERAFQVAQRASTALYRASLAEDGGWRAVNEYILSRIFDTPADEMFHVQTVADAVLGEIRLGAARLPGLIGEAELTNLCDAAFLTWAPFTYRTPVGPATEAWSRLRYRGRHADPDRAAMRQVEVARSGGTLRVRVEGYDQRAATRAIRCEASLAETSVTPGEYIYSYWAGNGAEVVLHETASVRAGRWQLRDDAPLARFSVPLWYMHGPHMQLASLAPDPRDANRRARFSVPEARSGTGSGSSASTPDTPTRFSPTHRVHSLQTGFLNLRARPGNDGRVLRRLDHGTRLRAGRRNERGWVSVETREGQSGWVFGRFLQPLN